MEVKQISLTLPDNLFRASQKYTEEFGYRNMQELILELIRERMLAEKIARYREIENSMKSKAKKLTKAQALEYVKGL
jgi:hypothetical protein